MSTNVYKMASKKEKKARKKKEAELVKKSSKKKSSKKSIGFGKFLPYAVAIVAFTFICFTTAINNEFVNWDDDKNFYENEHITSLNEDNFWSNTYDIFTNSVIGGYNPLSVWTFALEKTIFGFEKPMYWHLNNVLLHLICTFLVFLIGRKLGLTLWASVLFAGLFGVHPLRVESVAWVTERKDVLYGAFYLTAILYYLKYILEERKKSYMVIIWVCFILSLFSKIQAVILPISFILIDYYFDGSLDFKKILRKAPLFVGSLIIGIINIRFLSEQGSFETNVTYTGISRLFIGSYQYSVYLVKSLIPYRMAPLYPYPSELPMHYYVSILSFILSAIIMVWAYLKNKKVIFFGLGFFIANVFFLLQILGAGQGFLADRFTYIAYLGLFFIYSYYFGKLLETKAKYKTPLIASSMILLLVYGFITFNQNKIWKNSGTLWTHVLKYSQNSTLPYGNRANYYRDNGQKDLALIDYNERIRLKADDAGVFNSRARLFFNSNNRDTLLLALNDYNKAIDLKLNEINKLKSTNNHDAANSESIGIAEYYVNKGATFAKLGNYDQALVNLNEGVKFNPNFVNAYHNRSVIYNMRKQFPEALADINKFLEFRPYNAQILYEKARLHNVLRQPTEALNAANKSLKYGYKNGLIYVERAKAYHNLQKFAEAKQDLKQAQNMKVNIDQGLINTIMSK